MKITWIGQSGYILKTSTTKVVLDPYLSDVVNTVAGRPRLVKAPIDPETLTADAIICTHNHLDHLDPVAIDKMDKNLYYITTNEGKSVLRDMGKSCVAAITAGHSISVGDITVTAVYAKHTVEAFGVIVQAEGKTLYFSGDTLFDEKLFEISAYRPDVTFLCINGLLGNMNAQEALTVAKAIGAPVNIPNHYGMFASNTADPHTFADRIHGGRILEFNKEYTF